jgi:glyoxylase-like metal-dependent hydrolase (beta-lactamase superfamily II)
MASVRVDIISIGALDRNRIWGETQAVRTAHATTTLVRTSKRAILIDPGLPGAALGARLFERTGLRPEQIDTVFLTSFRPEHRAGLALFDKAKWLVHEIEQQSAEARLKQRIDEAPEEDEDRAAMKLELALLNRLSTPDDRIAEFVDLFPLFGVTPGNCGVLIAAPTNTVLITGDAVPTLDHFLAGQVLPDASDIRTAQESLSEAYEIADLIVPGHDNIFMNPRMQGI